MKRMAKVMAVVAILVTLTVGNSLLMAAPGQGASVAVQHSSRLGLFDMFLRIFGGIWRSDNFSRPQATGAGTTDGGIWGGGGICRTGC